MAVVLQIDRANHSFKGPVTPPYDEMIERQLLGCLLQDNSVHDQIVDLCRMEHFYIPAHGKIYQSICTLINKGLLANPTTLRPFFTGESDLTEVGGANFLVTLHDEALAPVNAKQHAEAVYDLFVRRQLLKFGQDTIQEVQLRPDEIGKPTSQLIETAEARIFQLSQSGTSERGPVTFQNALKLVEKQVDEAHKRQSHVVGVTTGFRDIDKKMGGLHRSDLIILAGRPSMGKTALATNIAFNAAQAYERSGGTDGAPVLFFSLEMSFDQLAMRLLSKEARVPSEKIRRGDLTNSDLGGLVKASASLYGVPLFIDDTPAISPATVRSRARKYKRQHNIGMIIIDYLQLMQSGTGKYGDSRVNEVSEITRNLKAIAKELQVPVIALSQLSRATESREDHRPQLSDLRESGSIEQDADVVMFVFREEYYMAREEPTRKADETDAKFNERYGRWMDNLGRVKNKAEAIVSKQRHGPIGSVTLFFDGQFTQFGDYTEQHSIER